MCNAEIIHNAQAMAGIMEECHTYARWKSMGYQVKRGEHAAFSTSIWKYTKKKNEQGEEESHMFMKKSHFFSRSQVEKIK